MNKSCKHMRMKKIIFHSPDFTESIEYPLNECGCHITKMGRAKRKNYKNNESSNSSVVKQSIIYTSTSESQTDSQTDSQISSPETNHQPISFFEEQGSLILNTPCFYNFNNLDLSIQTPNEPNILENDYSQLDLSNPLHMGLASFLNDIQHLDDSQTSFTQSDNILIDDQYFENAAL